MPFLKRFRSFVFLLLMLCVIVEGIDAQPTVVNAMDCTPEEFVRRIFLGDDFYLEHVTYNNFDTLTLQTGCQLGLFYNDTDHFPEFAFDSCLVLCTGGVFCAGRPFIHGSGGHSHCPPFIRDLVCPELFPITQQPIVYPAFLEFDFSVNATKLSFEYIFASYEYVHCYTGFEFGNDAFAFFLTDLTTGDTINIAQTADSLPININNTNYQTMNPLESYHNIPISVPQGIFDEGYFHYFPYFGYLSPMYATAEVVPQRLYHAKICIAHGKNGSFNGDESAVFFKCNVLPALDLNTQIVLENNELDYVIPACNPADMIFTNHAAPRNEACFIQITYSGSATALLFDPPLPPAVVIPAGDSIATLPIHPVQNTTLTDTLTLLIEHECKNGAVVYTGIDTLLIVPNIQQTISTYACVGDTYHQFWLDTIFTASGTFTFQHTDTTAYGCDSTTKLQITVHEERQIVLNETICHGESYTQNGFYFIQPEQDITYTQSLQTTHGCDSIVTLNLTVAPVFTLDTFVAICPGNVFNELGFSGLTTPGVYTQNLSTTLGCDSTIRLTLDVYPISIYTVSGGGGACSEEGGNLFLDGSDFGRPYKVYCNGTLIETVLGTGNPMQLGPYHESGIYNVECYVNEFCNDFMLGESVLHVTPTPPAREIFRR